jgi:release factor glutamine methyltransferase
MTVLEVLNWATGRFKEHRVENPRLNAELLLARTLNVGREGLYIHLQDPLGEKEREVVERLVQRRLSGEPLQYILGRQEFWSIDLRVDPRVLIPRPDTEILVEQAVSILSEIDLGKPASVLEIGTGSGAIAIALAREAARILLVAADISLEAVRLARSNAGEAGVLEKILFVTGDLFGPFRPSQAAGPFDLILSNPPYIVRSEIERLEREVKDFEPILALDGGEDGLVFHRKIVSESPGYLRRGGWLLLEVGQAQADRVCEMAETAGDFDSIGRVRDRSGIERVVKARKR